MDVDSFYRLPRDGSERACDGTACFVARHLRVERPTPAPIDGARIYCLGKCHLAPATTRDQGRPTMAVRARRGVVLDRLVEGDVPNLAEYESRGGYRALAAALRRGPAEILGLVEGSGLRGRGGAAFPTGRKWRAVADQPPGERFVVANADEGDPGAYIDRWILEGEPHRVIEALAIAAHAVGARRGFIYLRGEYPAARLRLEAALAEARDRGHLGERVHGASFDFDIRLEIGRGSYVCGEETALLNALEGKRPEVRARPPYPAERGLHGKPTLVQNVETLAAIPWIVEQGSAAYRALGFSKSRGTKVVSLNSLFQRPGLYEVELGTPVRSIVDELGGGLREGALRGVIIGGPLAGILPPALLDTPLGFEELHAVGAAVGHGGVVAFDHHTSIAELVHHVFAFGAYESCAKCTPCRLGAPRIERIFAGVVAGRSASARDREEWRELIPLLAATSLCGHGTGLADFAASVIRHYPEELERCFG
jgi:formate dehydrogenase iron-sulfur subunit